MKEKPEARMSESESAFLSELSKLIKENPDSLNAVMVTCAIRNMEATEGVCNNLGLIAMKLGAVLSHFKIKEEPQ